MLFYPLRQSLPLMLCGTTADHEQYCSKPWIIVGDYRTVVVYLSGATSLAAMHQNNTVKSTN
jgi:hypothetical protein